MREDLLFWSRPMPSRQKFVALCTYYISDLKSQIASRKVGSLIAARVAKHGISDDRTMRSRCEFTMLNQLPSGGVSIMLVVMFWGKPGGASATLRHFLRLLSIAPTSVDFPPSFWRRRWLHLWLDRPQSVLKATIPDVLETDFRNRSLLPTSAFANAFQTGFRRKRQRSKLRFPAAISYHPPLRFIGISNKQKTPRLSTQTALAAFVRRNSCVLLCFYKNISFHPLVSPLAQSLWANRNLSRIQYQ